MPSRYLIQVVHVLQFKITQITLAGTRHFVNGQAAFWDEGMFLFHAGERLRDSTVLVIQKPCEK